MPFKDYEEFKKKWDEFEKLVKRHSYWNVPSIDQIFEDAAAGKYNKVNFDELPCIKEFCDKEPSAKQWMAKAGLLTENDRASWEQFNEDWKKNASNLHKDYKALGYMDRAKEVYNELKTFSEIDINRLLREYDGNSEEYQGMTRAIKKLLAKREYYGNYSNLNKEDQDAINSNDLSVLNHTYQLKENDPELQAYLEQRIKHIQNIEKARLDAAEKEETKSPYGKPETREWYGEKPFMFFEMNRGRMHPGFQITNNGCWSVVLSALLKHKGINISQRDIRQLKPENPDLLALANGDHGQDISDHLNLIYKVLPNTMFNSVELAKDDDVKYKLSKVIRESMKKASSPVGLWYNDHYYLVYGISDKKIYMHDPRTKEFEDMGYDLDKIAKHIGRSCKVEWLQEFQVNDDKEITGVSNNLLKEIKETKDAQPYLPFIYDSEDGYSIASYIPQEKYTKAELIKLRDTLKQKKVQLDQLREKLDSFSENNKNLLEDCKTNLKISQEATESMPEPKVPEKQDGLKDLEAEIVEYSKKYDALQNYTKNLSKAFTANKALIDKITAVLDNKVNDQDLENAAEIKSPREVAVLKKLSELVKSDQYRKKLEENRDRLNAAQKKLEECKKNKSDELEEIQKTLAQKKLESWKAKAQALIDGSQPKQDKGLNENGEKRADNELLVLDDPVPHNSRGGNKEVKNKLQEIKAYISVVKKNIQIYRSNIQKLESEKRKLTSDINGKDQIVKKIEAALAGKDRPTEKELNLAQNILSSEDLKKMDEKLKNLKNQLKRKIEELNKQKLDADDERIRQEEGLDGANRALNAKNTQLQNQLNEDERSRIKLAEIYDVLKDSRDYGWFGGHSAFHRMRDALNVYKDVATAVDLSDEEKDRQLKTAAKTLYDASRAYIDRHLVIDKDQVKLAHQKYLRGVVRKQAAVQILELLENLPEYYEELQKQNDLDNVIGQKENPQPKKEKKGKKVKKEKISFSEMEQDLKESLTKHAKSQQLAKTAYVDLEEAMQAKKLEKENRLNQNQNQNKEK